MHNQNFRSRESPKLSSTSMTSSASTAASTASATATSLHLNPRLSSCGRHKIHKEIMLWTPYPRAPGSPLRHLARCNSPSQLQSGLFSSLLISSFTFNQLVRLTHSPFVHYTLPPTPDTLLPVPLRLCSPTSKSSTPSTLPYRTK